MTVTAINPFLDEAVTIPVETPVEAIDLVLEHLDPCGFQPRLSGKEVLGHLETLACGYGCSPPEFAGLAVVARLDDRFSVNTSVFIDMLWDYRQTLAADEAA